MAAPAPQTAPQAIKQPGALSNRVQWLRDYYFKGNDRAWNNEFQCFGTGEGWDVLFDEMTFFIVPETYAFFSTFKASMLMAARPVQLPEGFHARGIAERRAWFNREVLLNYLPQEILPGDLIAGGRFNLQTSKCLTRREAKQYKKLVEGRHGARAAVKWFQRHGYGNAGATSGHLVPGHQRALELGWQGIHAVISARLEAMDPATSRGPQGEQLRAMALAATTARDLAAKYARQCQALARREADPERRAELKRMAANLGRVPWQPPTTFWEAVQALWLNHMLIMSDENYPGPGVSFGRIDQYLWPYWQKSLDQGMDREFGKEILRCFWLHANYVYDAMIQTGNQGITSGYGQLVTLSGLGPGGRDMTNDLTYAMLEVIDELSPILEPKPNVRLHRNSPEKLLDKVVEMVSTCQGAPFLLNFDERSMAGMLLEARRAGREDLIRPDNVHDYAPVGCLENTMVGNDRSGTVDVNINLQKAVELALTGGRDMHPAQDPITLKTDKIAQDGPATGDPCSFGDFEQFWDAYAAQTADLVRRAAELYEASEAIRARFLPTPYVSCLVKGCAEKGLDITQGGPELNFVTMEAVTYASTVDSLLAVKYLVYDTKACTMAQLVRALRDNWQGHEALQAKAVHRAPKYGRDDDEADAMALRVMKLWSDEVWKYKTKSTGRRFRPGMLSWNYWVGSGYILAASPDGRPKGRFLSNAICPVSGADVNGPTANANSVGKALGGKAPEGDWDGYVNLLPNGASHTITFNPSLLRGPEHRAKFKAFLRGYAENGGTALQINMLDPDMLRQAQENPSDYRHLMVRITGYNAYFTSIGRELQDEVIARMSHGRF